ncbi:MAG: hypothetical protein SF187_18560 [Deltaproteobacteria bacterium]|nr:hypothetical protein [Deltaproteobacteria bacterium]
MRILGTAFLVVASAGVAVAGNPMQSLIEQGVQAAVTLPEATAAVQVSSVRLPSGCKVVQAHLDRAVTASGNITVKLRGERHGGQPCEGWARVDIKLTAPVMVTTRVVRGGEPLDSATRVEFREIGWGAQPATPAAGIVAARTLLGGQIVDVSSVRANRATAGQQVRVSVRLGSLQVEQIGRLVSCGAEQTCAVLPSGKRVEGQMEDDRLVVMVP